MNLHAVAKDSMLEELKISVLVLSDFPRARFGISRLYSVRIYLFLTTNNTVFIWYMAILKYL